MQPDIPNSNTGAALPPGVGTSAFAGSTRAVVVALLALAFVMAIREAGPFFVMIRDGKGLAWLLEFGAEFAFACALAVVFGVPLFIVGHRGAQTGAKRWLSLAVTIVLASALAALMCYGFVVLSNDDIPPGFSLTLERWWHWSARYGKFAALVTVALEFQRHATRSEDAMRRAEVDREALEVDMQAARLQVLQAQIEPHFLFNTLANVRRLYQTDPVAGRSMLDHLMRYLEVALPRMREARSTLRSERALAQAYLEVQTIRMGRRLRFEIDMPEALGDAQVPPMMLLTLVENAIKHGLNPLPEGGLIELRARREVDRLTIEVSDNGRGLAVDGEQSGTGMGLANIRARLAAKHGVRAGLELRDHVPRGVTATLWLPLAVLP
jgi:sensor histidine kinase YesM